MTTIANTNKLVLTHAGYQASASAEAGGFLIQITDFTVTEGLTTGNTIPSVTDIALDAPSVFSGKVSLVEVLAKGIVRFTLDLPQSPDTFSIKELGLFLGGGTLFARCVFNPVLIKEFQLSLRIYAIINVSGSNTSGSDLLNIDITVGASNSLPSTPFVYSLQSPSSSECNAIVVLDQKHNYDNTLNSSSPSLAIKSGDGNSWSFLDYSRIFFGSADSSGGAIQSITVNTLKLSDSLILQHALVDGNFLIVQIVAGLGSGQSRRFKYDSNSNLCNEVDNVNFTTVGRASMLAIWKSDKDAVGGFSPGTDSCWPPDVENIPKDWILTRGQTCPTWVSPASLGNDPLSTGLTLKPSNTIPHYVYFTGNGKRMTFDTGLNVSSSNTLISVSGITQHKEAYDVQGNYIVFSEPPPPDTLIEVIILEVVASTGTFLEFHTTQNRLDSNTSVITSSYISDGIRTKFQIADTGEIDNIGTLVYPTNERYIMCWITGIKQSLNAYTYSINSDGTLDQNDTKKHGYLVFNEAPKAGLEIQITWYRAVSSTNYATSIITNTFVGTGVQETLNLSATPEDYNYVFVYLSGILLHSDKYTLSGNKIFIPDAIKVNLPIMVIIFANLLSEGTPADQFSGVVTGAIVSDKYLKLQRFNAPEFLIPMPHVDIKGGNGIEVIGDFPNFLIKTQKDSSKNIVSTRRFSTMYSIDDSEEIIYSYKFSYSLDYIVSITADFSCRLGPGFRTTDSGEYIEYVLGFKTLTATEPPYGRRIKGTGFAGFSFLPNAQIAYSNASITQSYELSLSKTKTDTVTFVAKMRVREGNVSKYKSALDVHFSLVATPKTLNY